MKLLFEVDTKDYDPNAECTYRCSSCGIVIQGEKIAMCYIDKHRVYVIPGGGIEEGETMKQAVIREMHEETGLRIIPESIREYGYIHTVRKGMYEPVYVQDDYYFLCQAEKKFDEVNLTDNEINNGYHFDFVNPFEILDDNNARLLSGKAPCLFERDRLILEKLISDGMFNSTSHHKTLKESGYRYD